MPFFSKKGTQSNQDYTKQSHEDKQEFKKENRELAERNKNLQQENDAIRQECFEMQQQIEKLYQKLRENQEIPRNVVSDIVSQTVTPSKLAQPTGNSSILYADSIIGGYFNRVKETADLDTIFELHLQNIQMARFVVYNAAIQRVIANPSFLEGCEKQVLNNAQNVTIESEGATQCQSDGKWKIIKKLNVIIK
jgi:hypothetical protein